MLLVITVEQSAKGDFSMDWFIENWDKITLSLTSIVTVASVIVKMTPTPKDDKILSKIVAVLNFLAINKKGKK